MFYLLQTSDERIFWYSRICSGYCRNLKKKRNWAAKMATCTCILRVVKMKGNLMVSISLLMLSGWTADQWLGKFSPLIFMLVAKRVLICWPNWYIGFGIVHAAVFCTCSYMPQTFCFYVRIGKPYGPVARRKSIRNHPLAIRWIRAGCGRPGVFWPHGCKNS